MKLFRQNCGYENSVNQKYRYLVLESVDIEPGKTEAVYFSVIGNTTYADAIGEDYILSEDIAFASPSVAACFVAGASRNGYTEWHLEDGTLLKDIR